MQAVQSTKSDKFFLILFSIIIVTSLGIEQPASRSEAAASPEAIKDNSIFKTYSLRNIQRVYATGTLMIMEENPVNASIFIKASLPETMQSHSYIAWFYGNELQEWKKLGSLDKDALGNYVLRRSLPLKELDYDEIRITLMDDNGKAPGVVILKRELKN